MLIYINYIIYKVREVCVFVRTKMCKLQKTKIDVSTLRHFDIFCFFC